VICPCCGNDVTSLDREVRMSFPEPVRLLPEAQRAGRVREEGDSFLRLDHNRYFVRALLPVRLTDGHEFHFGIWLETSEEDWSDLAGAWESPAYAAARFEAWLANSVPPWDAEVLGARCVAGVRHPDELPYVEASTQPALAMILAQPWPRRECEQLVDRVWGSSSGRASRAG
jgi:hypothetical protein